MISKKFFMSFLLFGVVMGLASAGTYAYFSDTQTTSGNTIQAGTLKLDTNIAGVTLEVDNAIPGDTNIVMQGCPFTIKNIGTTDGMLIVKMTEISGAAPFGNDLKIEIKDKHGAWKTIFENGETPTDGVILAAATDQLAPQGAFQESVRYTYTKTNVVQEQAGLLKFKLAYELRQPIH